METRNDPEVRMDTTVALTKNVMDVLGLDSERYEKVAQFQWWDPTRTFTTWIVPQREYDEALHSVLFR